MTKDDRKDFYRTIGNYYGDILFSVYGSAKDYGKVLIFSCTNPGYCKRNLSEITIGDFKS